MKKTHLGILLYLLAMTIHAQPNDPVISLGEAISIALDKNHDIKVAKLQNEAFQTSVHPGKTGLLPTIDAVANGNYSNSTSDVTFAGNIPPIEGANAITSGYQAQIQASYLLFDGLGTFNSYKKLKQQGEISDLQSKISIESTILQLIANYYEVVRNQELLTIYKAALQVSKQRLVRVEQNFSFGSAAKIEVLNAKVDFNTDQSNFQSQAQNLVNAKRQLNEFLGNDIEAEIRVENKLEISALGSRDSMLQKALNNNTAILLTELNISAAEIDSKLAKSQFAPKVLMNASYGLNYSENNASIMLKSNSLGFTGALSISWNLFNGMNHKRELEKTKILIEANESKKTSARLNLKREFLTLYDGLQLNKSLMKLEQESISAAELNLVRTQELYNNGTLSNLQFRQAQINLLLAQSKFNNLKFKAKLQEFQLKRLCNELIL